MRWSTAWQASRIVGPALQALSPKPYNCIHLRLIPRNHARAYPWNKFGKGVWPVRKSGSGPGYAMKVFIVEDSIVVRHRLKEMLSEQPSVEVVGTAETAQGAISKLEARPPEAIILDLSLPEGNGFEVLQAARRLDPRPIVIVLTNFAFAQYRDLSLQLGADYFFDKSAEFEDAVAIVGALALGHDVEE